jgi:hypothetical protein
MRASRVRALEIHEGRWKSLGGGEEEKATGRYAREIRG